MNWVLGSASTIRPSVLIGSSLGTRISCDEQRRPGVELVGTQNSYPVRRVRSSAVGRASAGGRDLETRQRAGLGSPRVDPAEIQVCYSIRPGLNSGDLRELGRRSGRERRQAARDVEAHLVNGINGRDCQTLGVRVAPGQVRRALWGLDDSQQLAMGLEDPDTQGDGHVDPALAVDLHPVRPAGLTRVKPREDSARAYSEASRGLHFESPNMVSRRVADVENPLVG